MGEAVRETDTASYWLHGPAAAFAPWAHIVARQLEAEEAFAATGDESPLKACINVDFGLAYLPRSRDASAGLYEAGLRDGATDHDWRIAPRGTRFVTLAVDVQRGRFVAQAEAWTADLERTLVDRFDIVRPPETAPRAAERAIDPGRYGEDWDALLPLARPAPIRWRPRIGHCIPWRSSSTAAARPALPRTPTGSFAGPGGRIRAGSGRCRASRATAPSAPKSWRPRRRTRASGTSPATSASSRPALTG